MDNGNRVGHRAVGAKPLIGLTGRRKPAADIAGFPDILGKVPVDLYIADYAVAVLAAGGLPVHLPMEADPLDFTDHLHGVLLTGGADIEPSHYGHVPDGNGFYESERDAFELRLLDGAVEQELPVLGICRGLQLVNIHAGGTLHQHLPDHARYDLAPHTRIHEVHFEPETRLSLLYGRSPNADEAIKVNSLHHQTVNRLGDGLKVGARSEDGVVEGVEKPGADLLAVQWHPEMLTEPEPVFDWLIRQAAKRLSPAPTW